jgi:hypothetical protein
MIVRKWLRRAQLFEGDAHKILGTHEDSSSRVVTLQSSYSTLAKLNLKQDDLFRQALTCVEKECYRAAHVMAWAAFMDFLEQKVVSDGCKKLAAIRPKWVIGSVDDLRETINEYQIIETALPLGLCTKSEMKALHGLLNKRNECAHPTDYFPGLNETLGFMSEVLSRLAHIKKKRLK